MIRVASHLNEIVERFLSGALPLEEFQKEFVLLAWGDESAFDSRTRDIVGEVELLLAELGNGDWDEAEARQKLSDFVRREQPHLHMGKIAYSSLEVSL